MAARVKVITVARPKPSITRGGEEVGPSTPRSFIFLRKINGPTVTSASSVTCLRLRGTGLPSRWDSLMERPEMPQRPLLQHRQMSVGPSTGDHLLEDLLKEQALFSWSGTRSTGVTFRWQVIYIWK